MSNLPTYQAYARLPISLMKDAEGKYFALYEKQTIDTDLKETALKELNKQLKTSPSILSGEPVICGLYPRTDEEGNLTSCYITKLYKEESTDKFFTIRGKIIDINEREKKLIVKIDVTSGDTHPFNITMIYPQPIKDLSLDQIWDIKAEFKGGKLKVILGTFVENYIEKTEVTGNRSYAYSRLPLSIMKDEKGYFFAIYQNQVVKINLSEIAFRVFHRYLKFSPSLLTGDPVLCGLYPCTDEESNLKFFRVISVKPYEEQLNNNFFTLKGRVTDINEAEQKLVIKLDVESKHKNPYPITMVYSQPIKNLAVDQIWQIKAELKDSKLEFISGKFIENYVEKQNNTTFVNPNEKVDEETLKRRSIEYHTTKEDIIKAKKAKKAKKLQKEKEKKAAHARNSIKLEVTIKISELPITQTVEDDYQQFEVDCDGRIVLVILTAQAWNKITDAHANYPVWVASISGRISEFTPEGFTLRQPSVKIFERQPKEPKAEVAKPEAAKSEVGNPKVAKPVIAKPDVKVTPKPKVREQERSFQPPIIKKKS